ncbi:cytochrome P450 [Babesia caballi]|uniref:Cytochrome P450 n=1 Tax=Babesia caballi TaxID=5871 RepID=A0AAV4LZE4_BABCB|nr:cytochrome P450 [Babesia caballi]
MRSCELYGRQVGEEGILQNNYILSNRSGDGGDQLHGPHLRARHIGQAHGPVARLEAAGRAGEGNAALGLQSAELRDSDPPLADNEVGEGHHPPQHAVHLLGTALQRLDVGHEVVVDAALLGNLQASLVQVRVDLGVVLHGQLGEYNGEVGEDKLNGGQVQVGAAQLQQSGLALLLQESQQFVAIGAPFGEEHVDVVVVGERQVERLEEGLLGGESGGGGGIAGVFDDGKPHFGGRLRVLRFRNRRHFQVVVHKHVVVGAPVGLLDPGGRRDCLVYARHPNAVRGDLVAEPDGGPGEHHLVVGEDAAVLVGDEHGLHGLVASPAQLREAIPQRAEHLVDRIRAYSARVARAVSRRGVDALEVLRVVVEEADVVDHGAPNDFGDVLYLAIIVAAGFRGCEFLGRLARVVMRVTQPFARLACTGVEPPQSQCSVSGRIVGVIVYLHVSITSHMRAPGRTNE